MPCLNEAETVGRCVEKARRAMATAGIAGEVVVADNVFSDVDSGGVELADSTTYGDLAPPMGRLYDVRVLRNKFDHIGLRPDLFSQGTALEVEYAELRDAETLGSYTPERAAVLAAAVRTAGGTRLIDNVVLAPAKAPVTLRPRVEARSDW